MECYDGRNPFRYTPRTAPPHIRRKWARLGLKVRRKIAPFRRKLAQLGADLQDCNRRFHELMAGARRQTPLRYSGEVESHLPRRPMQGPEVWLDREDEQEEPVHGPAVWLAHSRRRRAANPELLLVGNNPGVRRYIREWTRNKGGRNVRRRRRHNRRHGRNLPLTIKSGGRRHTFRALVKKYGVKGALKHWRGKKKYHGYVRRGRIAANRRHRRGGRRRRSHNRRRSFRRRRRR